MKTLHTALSEKMLWDGLKASDAEIINSLLTEPVWQLAPTRKELLNESTMVNYTEDIIALGFVKQGNKTHVNKGSVSNDSYGNNGHHTIMAKRINGRRYVENNV